MGGAGSFLTGLVQNNVYGESLVLGQESLAEVFKSDHLH
jgi:hypothetical protein